MRTLPPSLALCLAASLAALPIAVADPLLDSLGAARADVRTLSARFTQETHVAAFDESLVSRGRLVFANPGRIRWEIDPPDAMAIVIDAGRVAVRIGAAPVERTALAATGPLGSMVRAIVAIASGSLADASASFDLSARADAENLVVLARPRAADLRAMIDRIEAVFGADRRVVREVRLFRAGGDRTVIRFENVRFNEPIDPSTFVLR